MTIPSPTTLILSSVSILVLTAFIAPLFHKHQGLLITLAFSLCSIASLLGIIAGFIIVAQGTAVAMNLPLGLPGLPFHIRIDPLAGFFLVVVSLLSLFVSIYSIEYVRSYLGKRSIPRFVLFYCLFIAGMLLVIVSDDALIFLISWEIMAVSSYFLVITEDEKSANRRGGFVYIVVAHIGALAILLSFGIMAAHAGGSGLTGYTFEAMRHGVITNPWTSIAFFLAFFGFAAKAGVIPLHVWLPEAHPVAPSNVSALMSGVMLKTAIYGIMRVGFDILPHALWWWGVVVLILGLISAVMGVLYALMQHDLKRLLAYHSVENIGIILIGTGLAIIFAAFDLPVLSALALTAALYHTMNHAMFKGLLFMGAGAVLHATGERNMEEMGGLIHRMPWTAFLFLIACVSISALPPFNGFVSEWLTFQAFLLSPVLPGAMMKIIIPIGAAMLALTGALAAACFVKVYGVTFLGHWRGHHKKHIHDTGWPMRAAMIMAGAACLGLGVLPTLAIGWLDTVPAMLVKGRIAPSAGKFGWMWLAPISFNRASYSGPIVLAGIVLLIILVYAVLHLKNRAVRRAPIWDCGFKKLTPRMQYTATSFAMPIRRIFGYLFDIRENTRIDGFHGHTALPERIHYHLRIRDRVWGFLYKPLIKAAFGTSRWLGKLQHGRIQVYLLYSFLTIIVLMVFLRVF
ncbi:MAG: hydrogenase 4 subunit B [Thermodesulfobacteriota bacterium]